MMNFSQNIHKVGSVKAVSYDPKNMNCVTLEIKTESGTIVQALFFGDSVKQASEANGFYYANDGKIENVVGTEQHKSKWGF